MSNALNVSECSLSYEKDSISSKSVENYFPLRKIVAVGMAMFSMFFGSGNIIFPVLIGRDSGDYVGYALAGLLLSSIALPFVGLIAISLFQGKCHNYFLRLGKVPAWLIVLAMMALVGPFGVLPRCIIISYNAAVNVLPGLSLEIFCGLSCLFVFACSYRKTKIVQILGVFLTPILLLSLCIIIGYGFLLQPASTQSLSHSLDKLTGSALNAFILGLNEGYNMMDLFAALLFSDIILSGLKSIDPSIESKPKEMIFVYAKASIVGMGLLSLIYVGMAYVASIHRGVIFQVSPENMLTTLSLGLLGKWGGPIVCVAISLACLTTAITLAIVFSEFIGESVARNKFPYSYILGGTVICSFFMCLRDFGGIQAVIVPILKVILPPLTVFTIISVIDSFHRIKYIASITYLVFAANIFSILYRMS